MEFRADNVVTRGTFSLDGQTFEVENNVWVLGNEAEVVMINAPHDIAPVLEVIGDRRVSAILATHAHDDHVRLAPALADATGAPIWLHPGDAPVWELTHPERTPDEPLADGRRIRVGNGMREVLHTPGHTPGAVSFHALGSGVCSPATRSSGAGRVPPAGRSPTTTRSSRRSGTGSSGCPTARSCTPATVVHDHRRRGVLVATRTGPVRTRSSRVAARESSSMTAVQEPPTAARTVIATIGGHEVEVSEGTTIYDAAKRAGVDIPVLCRSITTRASSVTAACGPATTSRATT